MSTKSEFVKIRVVDGSEDYTQDPSNLVRWAHKLACRYAGDTKANQPFLGVITSQKQFDSLVAGVKHTQRQAENMLEDKAEKKWIVTQGGSFSYCDLAAGVESYELHVDVDDTLDDADRRATAYVRQLLLLPTLECMGESNPRRLYRTYKGDHRSNAGLTFDGDRRAPGVAALAIKQGLANPYTLDAVIAGMRNKDGKLRNIYNDSFANYFREAFFLSTLFESWHALPYDSNKGDLRCAQIIARCRAKAAYGGDYRAMDKHLGRKAFRRTIRLAGSLFNVPESEMDRVLFWSTDLYDQPALVANELWYIDGDSRGFWSGLYPTHDIEGIQNFIILVATAMEYGLRVIDRPRTLKSGECFILVCGDDSIVLFGDEIDSNRFGNIHAKHAKKYGQEMELSKVEYSTETAFFCKKGYALRDTSGHRQMIFEGEVTLMPVASLKKALNAIYHPENIPTFPNKRDLIIWTAVIMDNVAGNKQYANVVYHLVDQNRDLFSRANLQALEISDELVEIFCKDWWTSKTFDKDYLKTSPTILLLYKYCK